MFKYFVQIIQIQYTKYWHFYKNIVVGVEGSAQLAKWVSNVSGWKPSLFFDKFEKQHFEQKQKVIARRAFVNCSSSCFHLS